MPQFLTIGRRRGWSKRAGGGDVAAITPDAVIQSLIDGELDAGSLSFYTAPRPASTADAPSGVTLLSDLTFDTPSAPFGNLISSSSIRLTALGGIVYVAGTVAWARAKSVDGAHVYDFDVVLSGGPNTVAVSSLTWTVGQILSGVTITVDG